VTPSTRLDLAAVGRSAVLADGAGHAAARSKSCKVQLSEAVFKPLRT